ncbi:MAG: GNAT family N-acetyltransferase [Clostridia bacterium]|nr:GNAT family N-acetyltransferase [Clostridia bacterium]
MNKTGTQTIETHRLILRPFCIEDADDMFTNWASDPEVTRFLTWPAHPNADVTRMILKDWISRYEDGGFFNWAIALKESGSVIGNISVVRLEEAIEEAEVGYCMGRAYWGQGIMPEALRAVMDYLFDTVGVNRIMAGYDVNNPKSGRVMEKAGMQREGIRRGAGINNRGLCDVCCWSLLRKDRGLPVSKTLSPVTVRFAKADELDAVNELRRQVNDLHVAGRPDTFKPGFCEELRNFIHTIWEDPQREIVVAELEGRIVGFAVLNHIVRPENPFMYERDFLDIDEFAVDKNHHRQGIASEMVRFIVGYAREKNYSRVELNMWEFNRNALAFYEAAGFTTYRRYMEIRLK